MIISDKSKISLGLAITCVCGLLATVGSYAANRVELKNAKEEVIQLKETAKDHEKRLEKVESNLGFIKEILVEIKSDVKTMKSGY
jgi:hypothetical protein